MIPVTNLIPNIFNRYERNFNYGSLPSTLAPSSVLDRCALLSRKIAVWQNAPFKSELIDSIRTQLREITAEKTRRWSEIIGERPGDQGHSSTIHKAWTLYASSTQRAIVAAGEARLSYELLDRERILLEFDIDHLNTLLSRGPNKTGSIEVAVETLIQEQLSVWRKEKEDAIEALIEKRPTSLHNTRKYAIVAGTGFLAGMIAATAGCYSMFRRNAS